MKLFNEEQIKRIEAVPNSVLHFTTVKESGFKRGSLLKEDELLADIFQEVLEKGDEPIQRAFGCKICNFNFYKRLGEHYFKSKQEIERQEDEIVEMVKTIATTPRPKTTKTNNNKKKTTTRKNAKK